jgi:hypothetical protein
MRVTFDIPAEFAGPLGIPPDSDCSRAALEALALDALRRDRITEAELGRILGITDRYARDGFLKEHGVYLDYIWEDLERERAAFREAGMPGR